MEDSNLELQIKQILEENVNPLLAAHYGGAVLTGIENNVAKVRMTGACGTCPSAQYTLEDIIKTALLEKLPELQDVVLDTSVSQDLLDFAKKLLNHTIDKPDGNGSATGSS